MNTHSALDKSTHKCMHSKIKAIHFVGIGGVGMSGIAEVLHNLGYIVSGSDVANNGTTKHLARIGLLIHIGHHENNIGNTDVVVVSSAIHGDNPEIIKAKELAIPIVPRAMMLAELMRFKHGIAIAGTHGKTTTTSLCATVMCELGLDPTFIIGGKLVTSDAHAKLGSGDYLVAEADESDASFLHLSPMIAVITNIDLDHMDTYSHDFQKLSTAFIEFAHRVPFYGKVIVCGEDAHACEIIPHIKRTVITYGLSDKHDIYATNIRPSGLYMCYDLTIKNLQLSVPIKLKLSGIHNVLNSLSVIAVALECALKSDIHLGIHKKIDTTVYEEVKTTVTQISHALEHFQGVGRRAELYSNIKLPNGVVDLIDDYGHHPTEIKVTLDGIKNAYPDRPAIVVFQPHRYTRTRDLFDEFVSVLNEHRQTLIIIEVYAAGEEPIANANAKSIVKALRILGHQNVMFANSVHQAYDMLTSIASNGDLIITMGAGDIGTMHTLLCKNNNHI